MSRTMGFVVSRDVPVVTRDRGISSGRSLGNSSQARANLNRSLG